MMTRVMEHCDTMAWSIVKISVMEHCNGMGHGAL